MKKGALQVDVDMNTGSVNAKYYDPDYINFLKNKIDYIQKNYWDAENKKFKTDIPMVFKNGD